MKLVWQALLVFLVYSQSDVAIAADESRPSRAEELLEIITSTYANVSERLRQSRDDAALVEEYARKETAERASVARCNDALNLKSQIACIQSDSTRFDDRYGRRFPKGEARFKILDVLAERQRAAEQQASLPAKPQLSERIGGRCRALPNPQRTSCLDLFEKCLRMTRQSLPASTACLNELDETIDKSDLARRPAVQSARSVKVPNSAKHARSPECAILDDAARSTELSNRDPARHMQLLTDCL